MVHQADHTTMNSSIALLQRRFRELERMKIIRQERELMRKLLQQSEEKYHHQPKFFHHSHHYHHKKKPHKPKVQLITREPEIVELKPMSPIQLSLSLWPEEEKKKPGFHRPIVEATPSPSPLMTKPWLTDDSNKTTFVKKGEIIHFDESFCDVDTSLHL